MSLFGPPNINKLKAKGDVQGLIRALSFGRRLSFEKDPRVSKAAAGALGEIGGPAVEAMRHILIDTTKDYGSHAREDVIEALGEIGDDLAVEALEHALSIYNGEMGRGPTLPSRFFRVGELRQAAIDALARIGAPVDKSLTADPSWESAAAAKTKSELAKIRSSRDVDFLVAALEYHYPGDSEGVRPVAARALGQIGDARAVEPLNAAREKEDEDLRKAAAWALRKIEEARTGRGGAVNS